jgi:hypothetical protein
MFFASASSARIRQCDHNADADEKAGIADASVKRCVCARCALLRA